MVEIVGPRMSAIQRVEEGYDDMFLGDDSLELTDADFTYSVVSSGRPHIGCGPLGLWVSNPQTARYDSVARRLAGSCRAKWLLDGNVSTRDYRF